MEIKSSKEYSQIVFLMYGIIAIAFLLIATDKNSNLISPFIICIILIILITRYWVAVGRTVIIDSMGISVEFLGVEKRYDWEEIKVRHIENYKNSIGYRLPYLKGAVFCKYELHKPRWMMSATYGMLLHPFSFVFIHFPVEQTLSKGIRCPDLYVIDEDVFRETIKSLGIELIEQ